MNKLSVKELDIFANKILEDYDAKNPGTIFKEKIKISNDEALLIQSNVANLRKRRGEENKIPDHEKYDAYKRKCTSKN